MPIYCMWDHFPDDKIFQVLKIASICIIILNLIIIIIIIISVVKDVFKCTYTHICKCVHMHTHIYDIYGIYKFSCLLGVVCTVLLVCN